VTQASSGHAAWHGSWWLRIPKVHMDGTAVAAHLHEKGGAYALDRRKQANNQAPKWHDLPLPRAPDSPTLRRHQSQSADCWFGCRLLRGRPSDNFVVAHHFNRLEIGAAARAGARVGGKRTRDAAQPKDRPGGRRALPCRRWLVNSKARLLLAVAPAAQRTGVWLQPVLKRKRL